MYVRENFPKLWSLTSINILLPAAALKKKKKKLNEIDRKNPYIILTDYNQIFDWYRSIVLQ
jgi:hypothetical protein